MALEGTIALAAILITYILLFPLRAYLTHAQILDHPNQRSSHIRPTPRGGGLLIVGVTLVGLVLYLWSAPTVTPWISMLSYIVGALLIALVSWVDDLHSLPNRIRIAAHAASAILVLFGIGYWSTIVLPFVGTINIGSFGIPITFLWIIGLTNAYNFMDGIDGIAGSTAIVAGIGWIILGGWTQQPLLVLLGLLISSSSFGFLLHNWPPAHIFMGDIGSAFLGYTFAILTIFAMRADQRLFMAGIIVLWPFLLDTAFTLIQRLRRGENIFAAHRSHLYQRLVIVGYSHQTVTLLYTALAGIGLIVAYLSAIGNPIADWLIVIGIPFVAITLIYFVNFQEARLRQLAS